MSTSAECDRYGSWYHTYFTRAQLQVTTTKLVVVRYWWPVQQLQLKFKLQLNWGLSLNFDLVQAVLVTARVIDIDSWLIQQLQRGRGKLVLLLF